MRERHREQRPYGDQQQQAEGSDELAGADGIVARLDAVHDASVYMVRAVPRKQERNMALHRTRQRAIRLWLYAVAALIFAMVLVGGATRLTELGLSIVEWKPVTGTCRR